MCPISTPETKAQLKSGQFLKSQPRLTNYISKESSWDREQDVHLALLNRHRWWPKNDRKVTAKDSLFVKIKRGRFELNGGCTHVHGVPNRGRDRP